MYEELAHRNAILLELPQNKDPTHTDFSALANPLTVHRNNFASMKNTLGSILQHMPRGIGPGAFSFQRLKPAGEGGAKVRMPNILDRSPSYEPTGVVDDRLAYCDSYELCAAAGEVNNDHEFPGTEGYRPSRGYFEQNPCCDRLMRVWMEDCAFKDFPDR